MPLKRFKVRAPLRINEGIFRALLSSLDMIGIFEAKLEFLADVEVLFFVAEFASFSFTRMISPTLYN